MLSSLESLFSLNIMKAARQYKWTLFFFEFLFCDEEIFVLLFSV